MTFADRKAAGKLLAARLAHLRGQSSVVLGLPRGGVPVGYEVACVLAAPLDVIVVRKLGVPFQPELGMGAVGEDGVQIINQDVVRAAGVSAADLAAVEAREQAEVRRRAARYRDGRARVPLHDNLAVIVDDGIATGSTALAACRIARMLGASSVTIAVPVAPPGWQERFAAEADEMISLAKPEPFLAIGQFYADFSATSDEEVIACLARAAARGLERPEGQAAADDAGRRHPGPPNE